MGTNYLGSLRNVDVNKFSRHELSYGKGKRQNQEEVRKK